MKKFLKTTAALALLFATMTARAVWNPFRDADGNPIYPQQPMLIGPLFTRSIVVGYRSLPLRNYIKEVLYINSNVFLETRSLLFE